MSEDGANLVMRSSPIAFKASGKFWVNNHAHVVVPHGYISIDYLIYYLEYIDIKPYISGAAQPKLTKDDLESIPVVMPPVEEHDRLVRRLSNQIRHARDGIELLQAQRNTINALPAALLRRAFGGEL